MSYANIDDETMIARVKKNLKRFACEYIVYICIERRYIKETVLTSLSKAQENMIDVLPLDTAVIPGQVLSVFFIVDEIVHVPDVPYSSDGQADFT